MQLSKNDLLGQKCKIKVLDDLEGRIIAVMFSKYGAELQVGYALNGEYHREWFFDYDID